MAFCRSLALDADFGVRTRLDAPFGPVPSQGGQTRGNRRSNDFSENLFRVPSFQEINHRLLVPQIHIQDCGSGWRAGQHVHVRLISPGGVSTESHSFSIVNAPPTPKSIHAHSPSRSLFSAIPTSATPPVQDANKGDEDEEAQSILTLAARVTGTWTRNLNSFAREGSFRVDTSSAPGTSSSPIPSSGDESKSPIRVLLDGPYGAPPVPSGERVVLVCGGSGAAYVVGVLTDWLTGGPDPNNDPDDSEEDTTSPSRHPGVHSVLLVWYIREARCVRWFADELRRVGALARARGVAVVLRICVTRERGRRVVSQDQARSQNRADGAGSPSGAAKDYRLSTLSELDARQDSYIVAGENEGLLGLGLPGSIEFARPCIGDIVKEQVGAWASLEVDAESDPGTGEAYESVPGEESDDDNKSLSTGGAASLLPVADERKGTGVFVVCCGPMEMVKETKIAVARLPVKGVRRAGGVWVHTEAYEL